MDNKQNRQFYWEVKQFINTNHTPKAPEVKNPSVKDAISEVLGENYVYKQNTFNKNTGTNEVVRSYLNVLGSAEKKNDPGTVMYTKNAISNPFNILNEAEGRQLNPVSDDSSSTFNRKKYPWAERDEAIKKHMDKVKAEQEELKAIRKASREKDEAEEFQKELSDAGITQNVLSDDGETHAAPAAARMLAQLSKSDRQKLEQHRTKKDEERLKELTTVGGVEIFGIKLPEIGKRDIKSLSSNELYDLKRIQKDQARRKAEQETGGFVLSGPTDAEKEENRRLQPVIDSMRRSTERFKQEDAAKARRTAINPSYGSVTPESFERQYGVPYNPRNPKHGRMVQALHGENAGSPVEGAGRVKDYGYRGVTPYDRDEQADKPYTPPGVEGLLQYNVIELDSEGNAEGGLNAQVEVPDPTQASRGMSQRSVATRAATMFGSGRSALDSSRRMNA